MIAFHRLAALLLAALPAVAAAQDGVEPAQCVATADGTAFSDPPRDLGQGFVAQHYYAGASSQIPDAFVIIAECDSDAFLIAAMALLPEGQRRTADDIIGAMEQALASEEEVSGVDLAYRLTAIGAPAQLRRSDAERCGCAAFYPGMRGDKTPWEAR